MNTEKVIQFVITYNAELIQVLLFIAFLGVAYLGFRIFTASDEDHAGTDLKGIEESLKKILSSQQSETKAKPEGEEPSAPETSADASGDGAGQAVLLEQLNLKNEEIRELKEKLLASEAAVQAAQNSAGGAQPAAGAPEMEEKIKELQAKLDEYAIIEDDIADLSFYKEETVRLKEELEAAQKRIEELEAGGATGAQPSSSDGAEPSPAAVAGENPELKLNETTPSDSKPATEVPTAAASSDEGSAATLDLDQDIMAEFQAAVEAQKANEKNSGKVDMGKKIDITAQAKKLASDLNSTTLADAEHIPIIPRDSKKQTPSGSPQTVSETETKGADLASAEQPPLEQKLVNEPQAEETLAPATSPQAPESAVVAETEAEASAVQGLGDAAVDMDKMLGEAEDLSQVASQDSGEEVKSVLEESLDTDKLLTEASSMLDDKVVEDFDSFVKTEEEKGA